MSTGFDFTGICIICWENYELEETPDGVVWNICYRCWEFEEACKNKPGFLENYRTYVSEKGGSK